MSDTLAAAIACLNDDRAAIYAELHEKNRDIDRLTAKGEALSRAIAVLEDMAPAGAGAAAARLDIGEAAFACLAAGAELGLADLARAIGRKPSQVRPALDRLITAGRVTSTAGRFHRTP